MKITIIGSEYQGLSEAALLSLNHEVKILKNGELDEETLIQCKEMDLPDIESCITDSTEEALKGAEIVCISIPVFYDTELNVYDLHDLDMYINQVRQFACEAPIIMRSEVPVGYTRRTMSKYPELKMAVVPDFSREGRAVYDVFNPGRLVIGGGDESLIKLVADLFNVNNCEVVITGTDEAESVKLFANSYLAMRVAFFNEVDTYAELRSLDSEAIIKSVSLDPRIGDLYNNPSFGFGGRYLVEGSCRLKNDFADIPEKIVDMLEDSNEVRKDHVVEQIMKKKPSVCGIYGLGMKTASKHFKYSAVAGVIRRLQDKGVRVVIFEPRINIERFLSADVISDFDSFCGISDIIIANRVDEKVKKFSEKLYSRDIFERD